MKNIYWISSSKEDLMELPAEIRRSFGHGLRGAQKGEKHSNAKVLKGFGGAHVLELIESDEAGTYRAVYTVKMADFVFVLHVFQKKSKHGIATPKKDMDIINSRLIRAQEIYKEIKKDTGHEKKD